jgi:NhaA family Na+:H+ antiporter
VAFFIMPAFALFNAGVELGGVSLGNLVVSPVAIGVVAGLVIGKPLGIFLFSYLAVKLGMASLPTNTSWGQLIGVGLLAGIGFTMALFICNLALGGSVKEDYAKLAILIASVLASVIGSILIVKTCPLRKKS